MLGAEAKICELDRPISHEGQSNALHQIVWLCTLETHLEIQLAFDRPKIQNPRLDLYRILDDFGLGFWIGSVFVLHLAAQDIVSDFGGVWTVCQNLINFVFYTRYLANCADRIPIRRFRYFILKSQVGRKSEWHNVTLRLSNWCSTGNFNLTDWNRFRSWIGVAVVRTHGHGIPIERVGLRSPWARMLKNVESVRSQGEWISKFKLTRH